MVKKPDRPMSVAELVKGKRSLKAQSKRYRERIDVEDLPKLLRESERQMAEVRARYGVG